MESVEILETPVKSENDKKEYKIMRLRNGVIAMLVSDPTPVPDDGLNSSTYSDDSCAEETEEEPSVESTSSEEGSSDEDAYDSDEEGDEKLAACALMVDVGSFSDPSNIQGLAHFLEHMIFMGSEKYPEENAFDSHIKKCGGFDNADTECEETSFYFEVSEEHLDSAMERFVALFEAPLMKKEAMTREREAVQSEFQSTLQDDEARRDQLLAELANPDHPCHIFTWGNLETLKENIDDNTLHERLHEFRKKHYSSHRMYVCLQARLPMNDLENLVVKHFSQIPSNNLPPDNFSAFSNENAFKDEFFENVFFVKPVSNVCKLELTWCIPSINKEYRKKPDHFMAYMLGYEGPGSLCAYLRRKLWALEMIAGVDDSGFDCNSMYALFNICIYLTEEGFNHLNEVLSATFSFLRLFEEQGPNKEIFTELQYIEATTFRFQTQKSAFDNVQDLVVNLKYYPPKDVLTGSELYFEYDEESIRKFIKYLNTRKFNIMITSDKKYNGIVYDKMEKWFQTEYTSMKIPNEWIDMWENTKKITELFLPEPNVFISKDFRIWWKEGGMCAISPYPKKIMDSGVCELWFRQDDKFLLPEAYMYFYFITPLPLVSEKNAVLTSLYAHLIKYSLVEQLYAATVAGLNYQYYSSEKGLVLKVSGYNEKLHLIVDIITKAMTTITDQITDEQLQVFIQQQKKNYYNSLIKPKSLNKDVRLGIIEHARWPIYKKYNLLKDIALTDFKEFSQNLLKELKIQAIIQGNLTEEHAHNVMNSILRNLNCSAIKEPKIIESRACQLPLGSNYILCKSLNEKDVNTVVCNFYQIGPCTLRTECLLDLLIMFVEEPLFDNLRTKEQLGYEVSSCVRNNFGILGYTITVNSQEDKFTASHVQERIEAFRMQMLEILNDLDEDEYEHVRESLIKIKQIADNELKEEVSRNWGEITCEEYIFDRRKQEVECLKHVKKEDIIQFCLDTEKNNYRKLSIQVVGNKTKSNVINEEENQNNDVVEFTNQNIDLEYIKSEQSTIFNIHDFKSDLFVYPVTKTLIDSPTPSVPSPIIENI